MEDLAYHRKYRAKNLSEYIGNEKNVSSILSVLESGKRPQVFLIDGHAGCGKTTFARLIAKEYICDDRDDKTGACGECDNCLAMDEFIKTGNSDLLMNVREIDNSVSGNKSDINDILNDAELPSIDGGWKVFIFDECHLITPSAQGRLLKVLEEPPEKVLMILCTTDPDKLLDTILSRCQYHYTVTKPKLKELAVLLKRVANTEGVNVEDKALSVIAASADFVPRQALILMEKVVSAKGDVTYNNTIEVLNEVSDKYYFEFYNYVTKPSIDIFGYIKFISDIKNKMDLSQFINGLLTFTVRGIYIYNGVNEEGLDISEIKRYKKIFSKFSPSDIVYVLNLLMNMKNNDIETKLMLIGYQGILGVKDGSDDFTFKELKVSDNGNDEINTERNVSSANFIQSKTLSDEDKNKMLSDGTDDMSISDLTNLFGGEIVIS